MSPEPANRRHVAHGRHWYRASDQPDCSFNSACRGLEPIAPILSTQSPGPDAHLSSYLVLCTDLDHSKPPGTRSNTRGHEDVERPLATRQHWDFDALCCSPARAAKAAGATSTCRHTVPIEIKCVAAAADVANRALASRWQYGFAALWLTRLA